MTIRNYLIVTFCIYLRYLYGLILLLGGPQVAAGETVWQIFPKLLLGAAAMTAVMFRFARQTKPEKRTSFWAYRNANIGLGCVLAATAIAYAQL